ncbi:hypothetical protein CTAYLR_002690 [Chrysophaeum taylorii]|uniref:Apple domain-containing protein n=1 Tax=Chrysophaeum taylorii TaxID=2483200 RepID=A0AAD7XJN9_9STRA|nr:hypothetical protein CTAYLR_002690 [Chrysophaeum taylorii]
MPAFSASSSAVTTMMMMMMMMFFGSSTVVGVELVLDPFEVVAPATSDVERGHTYTVTGSVNLTADENGWSGHAVRASYIGTASIASITDGGYFAACGSAEAMVLRYRAEGPDARVTLALLEADNLEERRATRAVWNETSEWREVRVPLDEFGVVDAALLRGWVLEMEGGGVLRFDNLACEGDRVFGGAFDLEGWEEAVAAGTWSEDFYGAGEYSSSAEVALANKKMTIDYSAVEAVDWGGFVGFDHRLPDRTSYYNLSVPSDTATNETAAALRLIVDILSPQSDPGRATLRFILYDSSETDDPGLRETWYSYWEILDEPGLHDLSLGLGDGTFDQPAWSVEFGNRVLDAASISGFRIEVSTTFAGTVDGEVTSGVTVFGNMSVLDTGDGGGSGDACSSATLLHLETANARDKRVDQANICCRLCREDTREWCVFFAIDDDNCFLYDAVAADDVGLLGTSFDLDFHRASWVPANAPNTSLCEVCDCADGGGAVDCSFRGLSLVPAASSGVVTTTTLNLSGNPSLTIVPSLEGYQDLEVLMLSESTRFLDPSVFDDAPSLREVQNADGLLNVITSVSERFGDACCALSKVVLSGDFQTLYACDMQYDAAGSDAYYETYVAYVDSEIVGRIYESSSFKAEATESPEMCAAYCQLDDECQYFSYDERNAEVRCDFFSKMGRAVAVSEDSGLIVSGLTPTARASRRNATVWVDDSVRSAVAREDGKFETTYTLRIGEPLRGAVHVTPSLRDAVTTITALTFSPPEIVRHAGIETGVTTVVVTAVFDATESFFITHEVAACDTAFTDGSGDEDRAQVYVEVTLDDANADGTAAVHDIPESLATGILVVGGVFVFAVGILAARNARGTERVKYIIAILTAPETRLGVGISITFIDVATDTLAYVLCIRLDNEVTLVFKYAFLFFTVLALGLSMLSLTPMFLQLYHLVYRPKVFCGSTSSTPNSRLRRRARRRRRDTSFLEEEEEEEEEEGGGRELPQTVAFRHEIPDIVYTTEESSQAPPDEAGILDNNPADDADFKQQQEEEEEEEEPATASTTFVRVTSPVGGGSPSPPSIFDGVLEESESSLKKHLGSKRQDTQSTLPTPAHYESTMQEETKKGWGGIFGSTGSKMRGSTMRAARVVLLRNPAMITHDELIEAEDVTTFMLFVGEDIPMMIFSFIYIYGIKGGSFNINPAFMVSFVFTLIVLGMKAQKILGMHDTFEIFRDMS